MKSYFRQISATAISILLIGCGSNMSSNPPLHPQTEQSGGELSLAQAKYDVQHYTINLEVDPDKQHIIGDVSMRATALRDVDIVELDLDPRLEVSSARVDGELAQFEKAEGKLYLRSQSVGAGDKFTTRVEYQGRPYRAENPPWDGGFVWDRTASGEHWIATAVQSRGCDLYWPCKDHISDKSDMGADMFITVPENLTAVMNGKLISQETVDGQTIYHWQTENPISSYNLAINIAPFQKYELTYKGSIQDIPLVYYHVTDDISEVQNLIDNDLLNQLEFYERTIGPFPWGDEKIGMVEIPYLGMEHQTMIGYGNEYLQSDVGFDWLMLHEFSHEWFGNLMTQDRSRDFWLHEGMASFMESVFYQQKMGRAAYWTHMWGRYNQIQNCKPVVPAKEVTSEYFDSTDVYYKGAWMLTTLRWLMGDQAFWRTLRRTVYDTTNPWALSYPMTTTRRTTEDFIEIASEEFGSDLSWFFDVYLKQTELPILVESRDEDGLRLHWANYPDLLLNMPIEIIENDESRFEVLATDNSLLPLPADVWAQVDPETRVFRDFGARDWCSD
jgi:aminopeptidase N